MLAASQGAGYGAAADAEHLRSKMLRRSINLSPTRRQNGVAGPETGDSEASATPGAALRGPPTAPGVMRTGIIAVSLDCFW